LNTVDIKGLTKKYKEKTAVDNLNLSIEEGQVLGLLGVNGAGKTTLIKMLSGVLKPTSGDAAIFGKSITSQMQEIKQYISVSPQESAVAPNLTVRENIMLMTGVYAIKKPEATLKTDEVIKQTGLDKIQHQKVKTLSGGQQRRLSIAMALVSEPKLLFLDEPTLGLDVVVRRELWKTIKAQKGKTTVILTTHYLEEAQALCDKIAIMADGKICALGTADEIIKETGTGNFEDAFIKVAGEGQAE
jgi:ABC-2 type transport system ATP-binding protein